MKTPLLFAALACLGAFAFAQDGGDEKKVRQIQSSEIADVIWLDKSSHPSL